ncbi:MAG TPA: hypothetical protein VGJ93_02820 [Desulfuromonadaceae bacterium]
MRALKRISLLVVLLLTSACATKDFVKKQADPLAEKINTLTTIVAGFESKISGLESRLAGYESRLSGFETMLTGYESRLTGLDTKVTQIPAMDQAALKETRDMAQTALDKASKSEEEIRKAQAAAQEASQAAKKCEAMFDRGQKK